VVVSWRAAREPNRLSAGDNPATTAQPGMPLKGRRKLVAEVIAASDFPLTIAAIADRLDIHPNTVRFHLDALVAVGQVERVLGEPTGRGRPPQMFRTRQGMDPNGPRSYQLLAEIGLSAIDADPDSDAKAIATGRAWGGYLVKRPGPGTTTTDDEAVGRLVDLLDDLGFAPERQSSATDHRIGLRNCPFLELIESHGTIICPIHLGVMQGAMAALETDTTVERLEPFAEAGLCLAYLANDASS
jgi:predicted ArsR family transcriptional regulator